MLNPTSLLSADAIDPAAIAAAATIDAPALVAALTAATSPRERTALALVASQAAHRAAVPGLIAQLAADGSTGRVAGFALGRLGAEAELLAAIASGGLDVRENGYFGLAVLAAGGQASPALASAIAARVEAEIQRAKTGASGLGEHACRVLAVLGAAPAAELIQQVIDQDRFCDRFELQRLRKAIADGGGRDRASAKLLAGAWTEIFPELLPQPAKPEPKPAKPPTSAAGAAPSARPTLAGPRGAALRQAPPAGPARPAARPAPPHHAASRPASAAPPAPRSGPPGYDYAPPGEAAAVDADADADDGADTDADGRDSEAPEETAAAAAAEARPVDWQAFATSPECTALPTGVRQLVTQLGPLLERLSVQAIRVPLADLGGQELVALLLQILPQALPPQHVQVALSPQALNGYQALGMFLDRTGASAAPGQFVQAVRMVRQQLREQLRRSGMLGGPDYSEPDAAPPVAP